MTQSTEREMSDLRIAIADDEPLARARLEQLCADIAQDCPNRVVVQYAHGQALANDLPNWNTATGQSIDVLLLDINMPGLSGIDIAQFLQSHAPQVATVFVTAQPNYAVQAFDLAAVDYVLKPVRDQRLLTALLKAKQRLVSQLAVAPDQSPTTVLTVHTHHNAAKTQTLPLARVLYFKAAQKSTLVRTASQWFETKHSLLELETWLTTLQAPFVRIHRNALLRQQAMGRIDTAGEGWVQVLNEQGQALEQLQISRRMLASLKLDARTLGV